MSEIKEQYIGRFASQSIRKPDETPLLTEIVGLRFHRIEIRLSRIDFKDLQVQAWIQRLFTRSAQLDEVPLVITVMI